MIEIKNLWKTFGEKSVLKGIDLKIEKGKVFAIIGPSGTGKSTLLRCLNVLERADKGSSVLDDKAIDFTNMTKEDIQTLRTRTAMVFQNSNLYRNKTSIENVIEPLITVKKMNKQQALEIAEKLLAKVGMSHKKTAYPETLSGGEKQRVGIARAMAVNADVILLDEPTSALDPELVNEVLDVIKDLAKQHTTMLIVTHEMRFAREVADEIVFMENGHIIEQAPPDVFFTNPQTERAKTFIQAKIDDIYDTDFDKIVERRYMNSYKWKDLKGPDVDPEIYPMWVADMEFKSSPAIQKQIQERVEAGIFGYETLSPEYFKVVSEWMKRKHSYDVSMKDILFCADTMIGISSFIQTASEVNDEVMLLTPVYGNFFKTIEGCGRKVVECPLIEKNGRFSIDLTVMEEKVSEKTRILLLCNPQNPTGTVWTEEELKQICMFCKKHGMLLISDEVHCEFVFNYKEHIVAASIAEQLDVKAATVISPGKSFNVPMLSGASLIIKDEELRNKVSRKMEDLKYPFAHAFVEGVTIAAYTKSDEWLEAVRYYIQDNKALFKNYFEEHLPELKVISSDATYLMWVDCSGLNMSNEGLEKFWRDDCKLILSHGSEFGTGYEQYRRFNVACSRIKLEEILERISSKIGK